MQIHIQKDARKYVPTTISGKLISHACLNALFIITRILSLDCVKQHALHSAISSLKIPQLHVSQTVQLLPTPMRIEILINVFKIVLCLNNIC